MEFETSFCWKVGHDYEGPSNVMAISCQPISSIPIIFCENGIWKFDSTGNKMENVGRFDAFKRWGNIYSVCFDLEMMVYITSERRGFEVFSDLNLTFLVDRIPSFSGPINISHPSTSIIGVHHPRSKMQEHPFGELKMFNWASSKSWTPGLHSTYDHQTKSVVTLLLLLHSSSHCLLSLLPTALLLQIIKDFSPQVRKLRQQDLDFWDADSWLCFPRGRVISLRRAWYPNTMMIYFIDEGSKGCPEDGVRCLWIMTESNHRSVVSVDHTLLSQAVPKGIPFAIEIPHLRKGELVTVNPTGMVVEGALVTSFLESKSSSYTQLYSATDMEGASDRRKRYITVLEKKGNQGQESTLILCKAL